MAARARLSERCASTQSSCSPREQRTQREDALTCLLPPPVVVPASRGTSERLLLQTPELHKHIPVPRTAPLPTPTPSSDKPSDDTCSDSSVLMLEETQRSTAPIEDDGVADSMPEQGLVLLSRRPARGRGLIPQQVLNRDRFIGEESKQHRKRCVERQRKQKRRSAKPAHSKLRNKDFLKSVDAHRESRNVIECVCEPERLGCLKTVKFYTIQAMRQSKSCVGTFCCPPYPRKCFAKVAFWPPSRGYFFVYYDKTLPWSQHLVQNHKIDRAKKPIALEENFSFGLEHGCCDRVEGVSVFIIENSYRQLIAGIIARPRSQVDAKLWIVYSHPNGSDLSDLMTLMPSPVQVADFLGANIITYDYPGYGISTGKSREDCFYATVEAVIDFVVTRMQVPHEHIVLWGYSIGTVCSVHAAMGKLFAGVMLFAPVTSIVRTLKANTCFDNGQVKTKTHCIDSFSNYDMITRVTCPLLIAHGELDGLIPMTHGQALLERAQQTNSRASGFWVQSVGHNNIANSSDLWRRVKYFLDHEIGNATLLRAKAKSQPKHTSKRRRRRKNKAGALNEATPSAADVSTSVANEERKLGTRRSKSAKRKKRD